jgi:hypothetical protein
MQKAACGAVAVIAWALVFPLVLPTTSEASGPTLALIRASSGAIGNTVSYDYSWDVAGCSVAGVTAGDTVILVWGNPLSSEQIGSTVHTETDQQADSAPDAKLPALLPSVIRPITWLSGARL